MDREPLTHNTEHKSILHNLAIHIDFLFVHNEIAHFIIHIIFTNLIFIYLLILLDKILLKRF